MKISNAVSPLLVTLFAGGLAGVMVGACDLPPKDIGDSDSMGDDGNGDDGSACTEPEPELECANCDCLDGEWVCPAIGCGDGGPGDGGGTCDPGDTVPADDGCNTCTCQDDGETWACTLLGCEDTGPLECEEGDVKPADDGCNTCTCIDGSWGCTEIGCPEPAIPVCNGTEPADAFEITAAAINGDSLDLTVAYSGGCAEHLFDMCWDGSWAESDPVQTGLTVSHDGMMDACDAYPSENISLDLSGLRQEYANSYGPTGTININLDGWGSIEYSF